MGIGGLSGSWLVESISWLIELISRNHTGAGRRVNKRREGNGNI